MWRRPSGSFSGAFVESFLPAVKRRLAAQAPLVAEYVAAAERHMAFRDGLDGPLSGDPAAGDTPTYVNCLHLQLTHFLATGDNAVGACTYRGLAPMPCRGPYVDEDVLQAAYIPLPPLAAFAGAWKAAAPPDQRRRLSQCRAKA